jgi:hypothetical protein
VISNLLWSFVIVARQESTSARGEDCVLTEMNIRLSQICATPSGIPGVERCVLAESVGAASEVWCCITAQELPLERLVELSISSHGGSFFTQRAPGRRCETSFICEYASRR